MPFTRSVKASCLPAFLPLAETRQPALYAERQGSCRALRTPAGAFTLVEMIVVVAVILVLVTLVVPAATTLWSQRKVADAENTVQGLLMTSRARAMQARGAESGLLFFVDTDGVQRIAPIEQADPGNELLLNVFRLTEDRGFSLPPPMRVVPRYLVEEDEVDPSDDPRTFSNKEIARKDVDFTRPDPSVSPAQRHRNFFTMVYNDEGELLVWRDVLIQDRDEDGPDRSGDGRPDGNGLGDRTGLPVGEGPNAAPPRPQVRKYYDWRTGTEPDIDNVNPASMGNPRPVDNLVADGNPPVAFNLPSVDGVLVYDDSILARLRTGDYDLDGKEMRETIIRTAQPFYIGRMTGAVIRGPVGGGGTQ